MEEEPPSILLSAQRLGSGAAMPGHCAWHGRPAVRRKGLALPSLPAIATTHARDSSRPGPRRLAEWAVRVRHVRVHDWPLCDRCVRYRRLWFGLCCVMFWGSGAWFAVILLVHTVVAPLDEGLVMFSFVVCLGLALTSPRPFVRGSYPRILGAFASADGTAVIVEDPHPLFAAEAGPLRVDAPGAVGG